MNHDIGNIVLFKSKAINIEIFTLLRSSQVSQKSTLAEFFFFNFIL